LDASLFERTCLLLFKFKHKILDKSSTKSAVYTFVVFVRKVLSDNEGSSLPPLYLI